jgi:hypothetical protein
MVIQVDLNLMILKHKKTDDRTKVVQTTGPRYPYYNLFVLHILLNCQTSQTDCFSPKINKYVYHTTQVHEETSGPQN